MFPCRGGVQKLQWWNADTSLSGTYWQEQEQRRAPSCCVAEPWRDAQHYSRLPCGLTPRLGGNQANPHFL